MEKRRTELSSNSNLSYCPLLPLTAFRPREKKMEGSGGGPEGGLLGFLIRKVRGKRGSSIEVSSREGEGKSRDQ